MAENRAFKITEEKIGEIDQYLEFHLGELTERQQRRGDSQSFCAPTKKEKTLTVDTTNVVIKGELEGRTWLQMSPKSDDSRPFYQGLNQRETVRERRGKKPKAMKKLSHQINSIQADLQGLRSSIERWGGASLRKAKGKQEEGKATKKRMNKSTVVVPPTEPTTKQKHSRNKSVSGEHTALRSLQTLGGALNSTAQSSKARQDRSVCLFAGTPSQDWQTSYDLRLQIEREKVKRGEYTLKLEELESEHGSLMKSLRWNQIQCGKLEELEKDYKLLMSGFERSERLRQEQHEQLLYLEAKAKKPKYK